MKIISENTTQAAWLLPERKQTNTRMDEHGHTTETSITLQEEGLRFFARNAEPDLGPGAKKLAGRVFNISDENELGQSYSFYRHESQLEKKDIDAFDAFTKSQEKSGQPAPPPAVPPAQKPGPVIKGSKTDTKQVVVSGDGPKIPIGKETQVVRTPGNLDGPDALSQTLTEEEKAKLNADPAPVPNPGETVPPPPGVE